VVTLELLGGLVADERARRGISQRQAAEEIGINDHTLGAIETGSGKSGPTVRVVVQVIAWLIDRDHRAGL
jgi:DNA-binding XRE family transcriptional regulator